MRLTLEVEPKPKARPRINTKTRGRYLPKRNAEYQAELEWQIKAKYNGKIIESPLKVKLKLFRQMPVLSPKFGDVDNLAKGILDACNGIIWEDDRQIISLTVEKYEGSGRIEMEVE